MGTVVGGDDIIKNLLSDILFSRCGTLLVESIVIFRLLGLRHAGIDVDELRLAERDGSSTDIGRSHITLHRSCLCGRYRATNIQMYITACIFLSYKIGSFEGRLTSRNS